MSITKCENNRIHVKPFIETAKANGQEPYWYLRKLFEELPTARSHTDILRLSPFRSADP